MSKTSKREREEAREKLREILRPGDTVRCVLRHVSKSGMSRVIDFYVIKNGDLVYLSGYIAMALNYRRATGQHWGVKIGGVGMDMGFAVVYALSYALFGDTWTCTGPGCPSNEHTTGDRSYEPHQHHEGGYALKHEWI